MKTLLWMIGAATVSIGCTRIAAVSDEGTFTDNVDPLIGSGAHGHVFVGANVPFGMVQMGPTSVSQGWDWCSGYHESDSTVIGFSHTHLSGTGCGDLLDITVMPVVGEDLIYERGRWNPSTQACGLMPTATVRQFAHATIAYRLQDMVSSLR